MEKKTQDNREVTLVLSPGEFPNVKDEVYAGLDIRPRKLVVTGTRRNGLSWKLLTVELVGTAIDTEGEPVELGGRRMYGAGLSYVYNLHDMPEWMDELAMIELVEG